MVCVGGQGPLRVEADRRRKPRREASQRRGRHGRMDIDTGKVCGPVADYRVKVVGARRRHIRPPRLVPAVAPDRPVRMGPHEFGDERQAVSCRRRRAQVETGEHQPGRGEMHMAVDERRRNEAAVEIDDLGVGELGEADVVAAQPHDGACADCHRGGVRHGRTVDPAALQKRRQLSRACEAMPGVRHPRCRHRRRGHPHWRRRRRRSLRRRCSHRARPWTGHLLPPRRRSPR